MPPFFSIIIPTKNRAKIVIFAIESVLRQTFDNYEIILVDNDDSDDTARAVEPYRDKNQIRYFRTGDLSMSDNWEFGVKQAVGTYITILEDKQILRKFALEYAHHYLNEERYTVATFPYSNMETPKINTYFFSRLVPGASFLGFKPQRDIHQFPFVIKSDDIINDILFVKDRVSSLPYLPRGITSFVHKSIIEKIQNSPVGRLCDDVNPDYVMAFLQLAVVDDVLILPKRLSITGNLISNGFQLMRKKGEVQKTFLKQLRDGEDAPFRYVPIKSMLIWNAIVNDFKRIQRDMGGHLDNISIPPVHYYVYCYWDIAIGQGLGADMSDAVEEWTRALQTESQEVQDIVWGKIRPIMFRTRMIKFGSLNHLIDVYSAQLLLKYIFRVSSVFDSPIKLLEWEETNRPEMYDMSNLPEINNSDQISPELLKS